MTRARMGPTLAEHCDYGAKLKRAHALILDVAAEVRNFERLSEQLREIADKLTAPRRWLEGKLIEQAGADARIEGVKVRDIYFGREMENA